MVFVEPGAFEIEQAETGPARERKRVERELLDRPLTVRLWFVVEDMDEAIPDLEDVDVTGERRVLGERHVEGELGLEVSDVFRQKIDRGYCENCGTNTVVSALVLAGLI